MEFRTGFQVYTSVAEYLNWRSGAAWRPMSHRFHEERLGYLSALNTFNQAYHSFSPESATCACPYCEGSPFADERIRPAVPTPHTPRTRPAALAGTRTRRLAALIFAVIFVAIATRAQQLPEAPRKVIDKSFVAVVAAQCGAASYDGWTTVRNLHHGYIEQNPLLGSHPSDARVWAFNGVQCGGFGAATYFLKRFAQRRHGTKAWWLAMPLAFTAEHIYFGAHNAAIYDPVKYPRVKR